MNDRDPHAEGVAARLAGELESANPYDLRQDFESYAAWNAGWAGEDYAPSAEEIAAGEPAE